MCTIFFQKSIKHILVPYKAVRFAVPVNILIIDVNLAPTSKEPQLSFSCMNCEANLLLLVTEGKRKYKMKPKST